MADRPMGHSLEIALKGSDMCHRLVCVVTLFLGVAGGSMAQDSSPPPVTPPPAPAPGLSRAEVLADLELWHRAGMSFWPCPPADIDVQFVPEYQNALARYRELRDSPAYQEAVIKYQRKSPQ